MALRSSSASLAKRKAHRQKNSARLDFVPTSLNRPFKLHSVGGRNGIVVNISEAASAAFLFGLSWGSGPRNMRLVLRRTSAAREAAGGQNQPASL